MRTRIGRVSILVVVGVAWAALTTLRLETWQDERRLWADAVQQAPTLPRPWVNLGRQYQLQGQTALAADAYRTALRLAEARSDRSAWGFAAANLALLTHDADLAVAAKATLPGDWRIQETWTDPASLLAR